MKEKCENVGNISNKFLTVLGESRKRSYKSDLTGP